MADKVKLGISSCLLGEHVRYDGGSKAKPELLEFLRTHLDDVDFVPLCPEVDAGFGIPREPVKLVRTKEGQTPRMVTRETARDLTETLLSRIRQQLDRLEKERLDGFIFKSKSPSCALRDLKIFDRDGLPCDEGPGLFTHAFLQRFPTIPVADEKELCHQHAKEAFVKKIREHQRKHKGTVT